MRHHVRGPVRRHVRGSVRHPVRRPILVPCVEPSVVDSISVSQACMNIYAIRPSIYQVFTTTYDLDIHVQTL